MQIPCDLTLTCCSPPPIRCVAFLFDNVFLVQLSKIEEITVWFFLETFITYHLVSFALDNNSVSQLEEQHHRYHPSSNLQAKESKVIACLKDGLFGNAPNKRKQLFIRC